MQFEVGDLIYVDKIGWRLTSFNGIVKGIWIDDVFYKFPKEFEINNWKVIKVIPRIDVIQKDISILIGGKNEI